MKVAGKDLSKMKHGTVSVELADGTVEFKITAFPYGFMDDLLRNIPAPEPPWGFVRGKNNRYERDESGAPLRFRDESKPEYRRAMQKHTALQMAAQFHQAVREDPQIEWDAQAEDHSDMRAFYEKIHEELKVSGITMGAVLRVVQAVNELSGISIDKIESAKEGFTDPDQN